MMLQTHITPRYSKGKEHALSEVKRIASLLGVTTLSKSQYDSQSPAGKAQTGAKRWGGWGKVTTAAGLHRHPLDHDYIPLETLAEDLLSVFRALGRIPPVHQLSRRSKFSKNSFTRKFGGYPKFKVLAIKHLLLRRDLSVPERAGLSTELDALTGETIEPEPPSGPHPKGRHLGFRAFAFAPPYEAEVVSLFSSVADDLGFEIVS